MCHQLDCVTHRCIKSYSHNTNSPQLQLQFHSWFCETRSYALCSSWQWAHQDQGWHPSDKEHKFSDNDFKRGHFVIRSQFYFWVFELLLQSPSWTSCAAYSDPRRPLERRENSRTVSWKKVWHCSNLYLYCPPQYHLYTCNFLLFALSFRTALANCSFASLLQSSVGKFSVDTIVFMYLLTEEEWADVHC